MAIGVRRSQVLAILLVFFAICTATAQDQDQDRDKAARLAGSAPVLWEEPKDISTKDLIYGVGGKDGMPHGSLTFLEEDRSGSNPKIDAQDEKGQKWTVKFGREGRPETVATRLLWAVGYYTDEDYFVTSMPIQNLPRHLKRGQNFIKTPGTVQDVRLKLHQKKDGDTRDWKWKMNPFTNTREFNGLRVMMALLNNWDLKDENNEVRLDKKSGKQEYLVSDVGSTFGTTGHSWTPAMQKGNLHSYRKSKFIRRVKPTYVDFNVPTRPAIIDIFNPVLFVNMLKLRWIGKHIPRADAKWMGEVLARLSPEQIRDAFRSAGYSPMDVEGFSTVVERRIAELGKL